MLSSTAAKALSLALGMIALTAAIAARADEPSPAALALAAAVISDVGVMQQIDAYLADLPDDIEQNMARLHPEQREAIHAALIEMAPEIRKTHDEIVNDVTQVLAHQMTEPELRQIQAFLESPAGKNFLRMQPMLSKELSIVTANLRAKTEPEIIAKLRAELKKKGFSP